MVTDMITMKLEREFLKEIDDVVKENNYQSRTEFIRNSLRENVDKAKMKKIMKELLPLKGISKRKTTDEDLERVREEVYQEFAKKFK